MSDDGWHGLLAWVGMWVLAGFGFKAGVCLVVFLINAHTKTEIAKKLGVDDE